MKKFFLLLVAVALISFPVVMSSCEEDNPVSCTKMITDISDAALDYLYDDSSANCGDYKDALKEYINSDCDTMDESYQSILDGLPC